MPAAEPSSLIVQKTAWTSSGALLLLLAISGLAILGLVFLAAIWAGTQSDAVALDRQRQLVTGRLRDQVQRVSQEVQLIGAGYASLLRTDTAFSDRDAISGNRSVEAFAHVATTVFGYNAAFLVAPSGDLALPTDPESIRRFKWVRPLLQPLIRDLETKRKNAPEHAASTPEPSQVELLRLEGRPSVAGIVSLSDVALADRSRGNQYYLIVFRFLDGDTLDEISREQGLAAARYARTADQEHNEVAYQIEATATGEPIGFIIWEPDLPGSRVIGWLVPVLSAAGLVIAVLFLALVARLRRSLRELSVSEQHARHLSVHDVLTGLPNRALFAASFERCLAAVGSDNDRGAIALVDLDRFKEVNDTYGHAAGDELLQAVVARISALIGTRDVFARFGGDEFALLFPTIGASGDGHLGICRNVIDSIGQPFKLQTGDAVVRIGCSIGVAVFDEASHAPSEIMRRADVALYDAKHGGRGRVIEYHPSLDHRIVERENLKNELRCLLEEHEQELPISDDPPPGPVGRLEVFYQSIHRCNESADLVGAEALVRWRHPTLGLLAPDRFIEIAEETGMIGPLGEWVLRSAALAAASWAIDVSIAVNVSPSQIRHHDFEARVLKILRETGLSPTRLELELTEASVFDVDEQVQATLRRLRLHGIKIALDDFGTGFSSLSHLLQLNFDRIKIDRSFVSLLGSKAEGTAIVSAVLDLSRTLGKETTAEGVETESQRDFLAAAGCSHLQGYLFSRPVPLAEFAARLQSIRSNHPTAI